MVAKEVTSPHHIVTENVNYDVMALTIKLLDYKSQLVKALREYNTAAEKMGVGRLDNKFFQQYGWIGSTINILSLGIRHIMSRFRTRGLDSLSTHRLTPEETDKLGKHFGDMFLTPLDCMGK